MKQSISGFLLCKWTVSEERIIIKMPIIVYLNMIDAMEAKDKLDSIRTDEEKMNRLSYEILKIEVVPA